MELSVQIPFNRLLMAVRTLTPSQKAKLRRELDPQKSAAAATDDFMELLLNGPVYSEEDIAIIEENRKSIAQWRTGGW